MAKRILIVDDEESVAYFLAENLAGLKHGYQVETANSGEEALSKMGHQIFDLVITDLRMPGINGLDLIEQARARSPRTRLVLMTGYGNTRVEAAAYRVGACRYLAKPFQIQELVDTVQAALTEVKAPGQDVFVFSDDQFDEIARCLADLRFEVNAQSILLADVNGHLLAHSGAVEGVDLPVLLSLIGGGFATAFEMARYLGEKEALTLNYHEGQRLDVYSANVNEDLFIVLLFEKPNSGSRIGMVWLYARRTLQQLRLLLRGAERVSADKVLEDGFGAELSSSMDQLFSDSSLVGSEPALEAGASIQERGQTLEDATHVLLDGLAQESPASPSVEPASAPLIETFDLDEALQKGLIDPSWARTSGDGE